VHTVKLQSSAQTSIAPGTRRRKRWVSTYTGPSVLVIDDVGSTSLDRTEVHLGVPS